VRFPASFCRPWPSRHMEGGGGRKKKEIKKMGGPEKGRGGLLDRPRDLISGEEKKKKKRKSVYFSYALPYH